MNPASMSAANTDQTYLEAIQRFQDLLIRAATIGLKEPAACALATADASARPSVRMVLLRGCDERGFVFFTNSTSRKGRELAANPHAALCFHWEALEEQARVEGPVEPVTAEENEAYWASRPRESRIGAWASLQSQTLVDRAMLEQRFADFERQFAGQDIPRPPHWFGHRILPARIEFWHGRAHRLHERTVYEKTRNGWEVRALYP